MQKPVYTIALVTALQAIQKIADNYNLRVIYDAAHAFGVKDKSGGIICPSPSLRAKRGNPCLRPREPKPEPPPQCRIAPNIGPCQNMAIQN